MATQATIARAPRTSRANTVTEQASAANTAFVSIAPNAHAEGTARAAVILNIATYVGKAPMGYDYGAKEHKGACLTFHKRVIAARTEWLAGRAAARMPAGEFKAEHKDTLAKIDYARVLIAEYVAPKAKKGAKALAKGKTGYRSEVQHKVIRAAEQAWSMLLAELSLNNATKQSDTDKKKRGTRKAKAQAATPTHAELVQQPKADTADNAHSYVDRKALELAAYAKKNASLLCTDYGAAVEALITALTAAGKARDARKAAKAAGAHNSK